MTDIYDEFCLLLWEEWLPTEKIKPAIKEKTEEKFDCDKKIVLFLLSSYKSLKKLIEKAKV